MEDLSAAWEFFDRVYCISVAERSDRREQVRKQFADVGLSGRVEFVIVDRHPENPEQGIFESHLICLNRGLAADAKHILIFEDDVFFRNFEPASLGKACRQLARHHDWNALFLGCITSGSRKTQCRSLVKIRYRCLTQAYAFNRTFAEHIVREKWSGEPYDMMLQKRGVDFFAVYPMFAFQGLAGTDNQTVKIDRMRRIFGGLPFIQRMNEFYQNHKVQVVGAHLLFLLGFAALVYTLW